MPPKRKRVEIVDENEGQKKKQKIISSNSNLYQTQIIPKNTKNNDKSTELSWSTDMPPEILFRIFSVTKFKPQDLRRAGQVCWSWNACLKDEAFGWVPFSSIHITIIWDDANKNCPALDPFSQTYCQHYSGPKPVGLKIITTPTYTYVRGYNCWGPEMVQLQDADGKNCAIATAGGSALQLLRELNNEIYDYHLKKNSTIANPYHYGIAPGTTNTQYDVKVSINFARLENKIRRKEDFPMDLLTYEILLSAKVLKDCPAFQHQYLPNLFDPAETFTPTVLPVITEQPKEIVNVTLHQYQIDAINWMVNIEKECHKGFSVSPLIPSASGNIFLNCTPSGRHLVLLEDTPKYNLTYKPKGGVIADEMGLGKTVEVIGLMLANSKPENSTKRDTSPYFESKATLVMCPNQLVHQWNAEIEKYSEKKLTVIQLTTIVQVKKYSYQEIMDADVVLVTHNLLRNNNYLTFADNWESKLQKYKDKQPSAVSGIILNHFHWYRIIIDEGHEIIDEERIRKDLCSMKRDFNWYMTGTPFPTLRSLEHAREFLDMAVPRGDNEIAQLFGGAFYCHIFQRSKTEVYVESALNDIMVNNLVWRNTKKSVKKEYQMVKTKHKLVLLSFSPTEQAVYDDFTAEKHYYATKTDPRRLLCTKLESEWGNTLSEIREHWMDKKKSRIAEKTVIVKELEKGFNNEALKDMHHSTRRAITNRFERERANVQKIIDSDKVLLKAYKAIDPPKKLKVNSFEWLLEQYGTKTANLIQFLRKLFEKDETARAIVFSQFPDYLRTLQRVLEDNDIPTSSVKGNVHKKSKELGKFKADDSAVKVVLLSLTKVASGMNLIEASHVIIMDPHSGTREEAEAYETQAVGRAYRQGQTKDVTVIRFIIKDSVEHKIYITNCANAREEKVTLTNTPSKMLVRSNSFGVLLANSQELCKSQD
jgi:SNF2 family DNA or RNA helicase